MDGVDKTAGIGSGDMERRGGPGMKAGGMAELTNKDHNTDTVCIRL